MSYGLSITYYKYPLYEALALARKQLNEEAKNMPDKNAIAWNLRKHSGSSFSGKLGKGNDLYHCFDIMYFILYNFAPS
ncbi:hypothetical protein EZS27_035130 [termite gut metagenome]|uniref:Cas10/Cmr2 second palm domain-containing protein n=1 Tax=termite gut metagenome TaxID=433724 RepID=A0A5J4PZD2_9ZZZZ